MLLCLYKLLWYFIYIYIYNSYIKTISNVLLLGQIKPDIHLYRTVFFFNNLFISNKLLVSREFECKYLFLMDKTVKTREVTHIYIQWTVLLVSRSDTVKTPYIPKIKGNKLNCFTKEWSNKQNKNI